MKKILSLLLVFILVFSVILSLSSCKLWNNIFGNEDTPSGEQPDDTPGGEDTPGGGEQGGTIEDAPANNGNGITLPPVPAPSTPPQPESDNPEDQQ